ncbi:hypothetical protein C6341_g18261 [Phytophthora cactorum]|nr:hypothetical protein C6341_g18261 [Phytophthora cactorum]
MGRWLTIEAKRSLVQKNTEEPGMTQTELAGWAKRVFRLRKPPARNTVSDILKGASKIMSPSYGKGKRRKPLKVKAPALEDRLEQWVVSVEQRGLCLNRRAITRKAEQIREDVGGAAVSVKLSVGWLSCFLKRHKLRYRPLHGKAGSADADVVREGCYAMQELTELYDAHDTYNMDETVLYYSAAPGRSICSATTPAAQLGYLYKKSAKAWMNTKIFQEWFLQLDKEMRVAPRLILLLVDNPLDAGIIASFKARFRSMQIDRAIDRFETGENVQGSSVYKIDQLQAIQWSSLLWDPTGACTVSHCWQKTGLAFPIRELHEDRHAKSSAAADSSEEGADTDDDMLDLMLKVASISFKDLQIFCVHGKYRTAGVGC